LKKNSNSSNSGSQNSFLIAFGLYGAIGFQLAAAVIAGLFIGQWIDQKLHTTPWLTILGLILGSVGGFYNLIRIINWKNKDN